MQSSVCLDQVADYGLGPIQYNGRKLTRELEATSFKDLHTRLFRIATRTIANNKDAPGMPPTISMGIENGTVGFTLTVYGIARANPTP